MSIGETLSEARRQAGLTITQVSQRTRIRESIIRGIEQGDFSACGGNFYARGHIKSIADAVGADGDQLIAEYDTEHGPPASISAADVFEPTTPIRIRERRSFGLGKVMIVVLLAVIGLASYHLATTKSPKHSRDAAAVPPRVTRTPAVAPLPTSSATRPPRRPSGLVIQVSATQDCWVMLTSSGGSQLYDGTLQPGTTMTWHEKHAVELRLGNPDGVVIKVDGKRKKPDTSNPVTLSISPDQSVSVSLAPPTSIG